MFNSDYFCFVFFHFKYLGASAIPLTNDAIKGALTYNFPREIIDDSGESVPRGVYYTRAHTHTSARASPRLSDRAKRGKKNQKKKEEEGFERGIEKDVASRDECERKREKTY